MRSVLACLVCLALVAGCSAPSPQFRAAAETEMARRPGDYLNGDARAFLVRRDGRRAGLLWGTMHADYNSATALPLAMRELFAAASDLHVESLIEDASPAERARLAAAAQPGYSPAALARLPPATRAAVSDLTLADGSRAHVSLRQLARLVGTATGPEAILPAAAIVDVDLIGFARSIGTPVAALEPLSAVMPLVAADPNGPGEAAELEQAVRRRDAAAGFDAWLDRAYAAGQTGAVLAAMVGWRATPDDLARNDQQHDALFTRRNRDWVAVLERALDAPGFHFVAFGAGHLLGQDGVVALLRARGWTVDPCPADACPP